MRDAKPTNIPWMTGRMDDVVSPTRDATDLTGGRTITLIAGATLKLGDVVYLSADRTVNKSNTASNHPKVVGIVVGGDSLGSKNVISDKSLYGVATAAVANEEVIVCISGACYVVVDAAIDVGVSIAPSTTTAGQVRAAVNLTVASGAVAMTSSAANGAVLTGDGLQSEAIIGKLLEASSAADDVRLALVNVH